jgi:hypothetical protein
MDVSQTREQAALRAILPLFPQLGNALTLCYKRRHFV